MMKKIKTIKQLQAEKKQLEQRRADLEKAIRFDWLMLKKGFQPRQLFPTNGATKEKQNGRTIFSEIVSGLAGKLTGKLIDKAETKMFKGLKK